MKVLFQCELFWGNNFRILFLPGTSFSLHVGIYGNFFTTHDSILQGVKCPTFSYFLGFVLLFLLLGKIPTFSGFYLN